jgi:uncharacterized protein YndB with AHSA1/START domain
VAKRDDVPRRELVVTRIIDAPPALVFELWTAPEHLVNWWGPAGFTLPSCELDFRVGGAFRYQMRSASGEDYWLHGVFREIVAPERIVFTFAWEGANAPARSETLVVVAFAPHGEGTKLTLKQSGFESDGPAAQHEDGWSQQLERLAHHAVAIGRVQEVRS